MQPVCAANNGARDCSRPRRLNELIGTGRGASGAEFKLFIALGHLAAPTRRWPISSHFGRFQLDRGALPARQLSAPRSPLSAAVARPSAALLLTWPTLYGAAETRAGNRQTRTSSGGRQPIVPYLGPARRQASWCHDNAIITFCLHYCTIMTFICRKSILIGQLQ